MSLIDCGFDTNDATTTELMATIIAAVASEEKTISNVMHDISKNETKIWLEDSKS